MSRYHTLERRIITGYSISASLFATVMNMIMKFAEKECRGPVTKNKLGNNQSEPTWMT